MGVLSSRAEYYMEDIMGLEGPDTVAARQVGRCLASGA